MSELSRRDFLALSAKFAALLGLGPSAIPRVAAALEELAAGGLPLLWLQGQTCTGCSVSLLNSDAPGPASILTEYVSLLFHSTLSAATGHVGMDIVHRVIANGGYVLVFEGSIPAGMPEACLMGHDHISELVLQAARQADAVVAAGTCAAFGGIPAAENNPTGAVGVGEFLRSNNVSIPTIAIPGCPFHPDWVVGTLLHVIQIGIPDLDELGRPQMFFSKVIHDQCPRATDFERENFATTFGQDGCLAELGCFGSETHADCTIRYWNSRTNSCINAGSPCIGCASEHFARSASQPFFTKSAAS